MKSGDLCPNCGETTLIPQISRGKPTGNLVCSICWHKYNEKGERVKKKKKERFGGPLNWRDRDFGYG